MQKILQDNGWREPDPKILVTLLNSDIDKFAILRNPLKRWISGFAECFMDMPEILELLDSPAFIEVIRRSPVFDNHTELQSAFIPNAKNLQYIVIDSQQNPNQFFRTVDTWFNNNGYQSDCGRWRDAVNPSNNDETKLKINEKLKALQNTNKKLFEAIEEFFEPDYQLMNTEKRITYGN